MAKTIIEISDEKLVELEPSNIGVVSTLLTVRSKLRKGDGSIFRDKGEKKTSYFWLKNLSDGLNLLTSFLSQLFPVLDPSTLIFKELEVH